MRKGTRIAAMLLSLSFVASFAACGGNPPDNGDGNGNGTEQEQPIRDTQAPVVTLGETPATMEAGESLTLTFTATDNKSAASAIRFSVSILNESNVDVASMVYNAEEKKFTPTSAGKYTIVVGAYDEAGNYGKTEREITVVPAIVNDTTPPLISFTLEKTLKLGGYSTIRYTVTDDISDRADIRTEVTVKTEEGEDVTVSLYDETTKRFTPTVAGKYVIAVTAYDEANNKAEVKQTITVYEEGQRPPELDEDKTPPVIDFGETPSTVELGTPLALQFTVSDDISPESALNVIVAVKDEADGNVADVYFAQTRIFSPKVAGTYKIVVTATDEAGNPASKTHTVTVTSRGNVSLPSSGEFGDDVFVHDPSIFYDRASGRYYAFGSHYAVASTTDFITWRQDAPGDTGYKTLYGKDNKAETLPLSYAEVGGDQNTWAPDVEKIGDKYYMYYSLTGAFGKNKSVIGRVSSDNVLGPYSNEELILKSDGAGQPNCIDPELFYDKDGRLWMVYGSFYAGIYIKELYTEGEKAGLPKEDELNDYGKLLWKGNSVGVEGPFIFYAPKTDYYYLMVSDGDLNKNYNMRVARSKNPDGPYTDITGKDMAASAGGGNKLTGNYKFDGDIGYAALGHNSVIKKDGKYLAVYHARRYDASATNTNNVSSYHSLRTNQLFFNEEGWPVLAPNRYAKESLGKVTPTRAAGDYDIVVHTTNTTATFVDSIRYTLTSDGKITNGGSEAGTWSVQNDCHITLTLGGTEYKGVIAPAWCTYQRKGVLSITATSAQGGSLWANAASEVQIDLPEGVSLIQKIDGNVKSKQIGKFTSTEGFAVSLTAFVGGGDDWQATLINSWGMAITLPNLDPWNNVTSTRPAGAMQFPTGSNLYPTANGANYNQNGYQPDTYKNKTSYVTVCVSVATGVSYYQNGVLTQQYPLTAAIGSKTVADFVAVLIDCVKESGFMLADGAQITSANDLLITNAVTDAQALAIYNQFGK